MRGDEWRRSPPWQSCSLDSLSDEWLRRMQVWTNDFRELEQVIAEAGGSDDKVQASLQERASSDKGHHRVINGLLFGSICDR